MTDASAVVVSATAMASRADRATNVSFMMNIDANELSKCKRGIY